MGDFDCCVNGEHEPVRHPNAKPIPRDLPTDWVGALSRTDADAIERGAASAVAEMEAQLADLRKQQAEQLEAACWDMLARDGDWTVVVWRWSEERGESIVFHQEVALARSGGQLEPRTIAEMPWGMQPPEEVRQ